VINKLAIVRDIEPASFGIEYSLLENLIARPFNSANAESLAIERRSSSPKGKGFLSAIKQRFAS
jgi:hypothetical protein